MLLVCHTDVAVADVHPLLGAAGHCHVASLRKFPEKVNILTDLKAASYPNSHASLRPELSQWSDYLGLTPLAQQLKYVFFKPVGP